MNYTFSQSPDAIHQLIRILQILVQVGFSIGAIADFIAKTPALIEVANQLLALINSGAEIHQIASALAALATTLGISSDAIINLQQMIGGFSLLF